jgi:hypothetical protein
MKTKLLPLLALFFLLFSCQDDEDMTPNEKIAGKYVYAAEVLKASGDRFQYESNMRFEANGTVRGEEFVTKTESTEVLGYLSYFTGRYSIIDDLVSISYLEYSTLGDQEKDYLPKSELVPLPVGTYGKELMPQKKLH